jgi:uncharacterized membrane protein
MRRSQLGFFPLAGPFIAAALLAVALLVVLIEIRAVEYAYARIGLGHRFMLAALLLTLLGSYVNVPLWWVSGGRVLAQEDVWVFGVRWVVPVVEERDGTLIAINLGGALIPILLSARLVLANDIVLPGAVATLLVAAVSYLTARPIPGIGIVVPTIVPPVTAAAAAWLLAGDLAPAVAYVSGTMGTLIGADLMNLGRVRGLGAPIASIGGAGTFDGIFVTGILAVLLA